MSTQPSKLYLWGGRILTVLPVLMLLMSAFFKFKGGPEMATGLDHLGWPMSLMLPLGILEVAITALYLFPRTAVLGAILLTGYLGGAIATHIRVGDPWVMPFLLGVMLWGALYLRYESVRQLIPILKETK